MTFGYDWGAIGIVMGVLFVVCVAYDSLVGWMERRGYDEGYTAILVVVGVIITGIGGAAIDLEAAILFLLLFVASGTPMIFGSWRRHTCRRREALRELKAAGGNSDEAEGLAQ